MLQVWLYSLVSVIIVSLISIVGVLTFLVSHEKLKSLLLYMVSFSVGGLFGDAFIHLIPEAVEKVGFELNMSLCILFGLLSSFIMEKFLQWRHCHIPTSMEHPHPFAYMNLFGDAVHNFIDGLLIAGSYLYAYMHASPTVGIATTLAVIFHEIPQEIGDFGVLVYGGFSQSRALLFNFLSAITAIIGAIVFLSLSPYIEDYTIYLLPFAAGEFIYIAGSDLVPELHKETNPSKSTLQLIALTCGLAILFLLIFLE